MSLSQSGNRDAFAEIVNRRQAWIRSLMRRCCGKTSLAEDLSQQVFMQAWRSIRQLEKTSRFGPWLKRLAINVWLQHKRRKDPLSEADDHKDADSPASSTHSIALDLDRALATLQNDVRMCIILAYHERMTHAEIATLTGVPLGTVKSHIRRGSAQLQEQLAAYAPTTEEAS